MRAFILPVLMAALTAGAAAQDEEPDLKGGARIDAEVAARWSALDVKPASRCDDATFLRRVCLDITGRIPSLERTVAFLKSRERNKRAKLADELLASDEYAEHWAEYWAGTILGYDDNPLAEVGFARMTAELKGRFAKGLTHDALAREIILAAGKTTENPLLPYYVREFMSAQRDLPLALTAKFSRTFLGQQIQCAQCHDHPFDVWTQEDFYGMAGFFSKTFVKRVSKEVKDGFEVGERAFALPPEGMGRPPRGKMRELLKGDLTIPGTEKPVATKFLGTDKGPQADEGRREAFVRILTSKDNLQFARAYVNRLWGHVFGRGLVDPIDDFNDRNRPWSPELLDGLAKDFIEHGWDPKWLMREIVLSDPYQRSSEGGKTAREQERAFAKAAVRALSPEQIMHSLVQAMAGEGGAGSLQLGPRTIRDAIRQFRFNFGDDEGADKTEFQGTIPQALLMMNSEIVAKGLSTRGASRLAQILRAHSSTEDRINAIFLATLCRMPDSGERSRYASHAKRAGGDEGYADVMWALLNSSEFLFNH